METVLSLVVDAFTGATERHIEVGDGLQIWTIVKGEGAKLRELRELSLPSRGQKGSDRAELTAFPDSSAQRSRGIEKRGGDLYTIQQH